MTDDPRSKPIPRRTVLRASLPAAVAALAGCNSGGSGGSTPTDAAGTATGSDAAPTDTATGTPTPAARVEAAAVPLETVEPTAPVANPEALKKALGDAKVVALGEVTHGIREFFRLKHRLFRFLVEEREFRIFGLEASFPASLAVNEYVLHGTGDPEAALRGLQFWTWNVESMLATIEWCRSYNEGRDMAEKVRFYGIDVQLATGAASRLRSYFERVDPEYLKTVREDLTMIAEGKLQELRAEDLEERLQTAETLENEIGKRLADRKSAYVAASSKAEYELAKKLQSVIDRVVQRRQARLKDHGATVSRLREQGMAETVRWILDHEDVDGMVISGHNGHVGYSARSTTLGRLGDRLDDTYGEGYRVIGFEFGHGTFRAHGRSAGERRAFEIGKPPADSVPARCMALDHDRFVLDFDAVDDATLDAWLEGAAGVHGIGAVWDESWGDSRAFSSFSAIRKTFDGLAFVEETSAAVGLRDRSTTAEGTAAETANGTATDGTPTPTATDAS